MADGVAALSFAVAVGVAAGDAALPLSPDPQAATSAAVTRTMTPARLTGVRMADRLCEDSRVSPITRGFRRREPSGDASRIPPGQHLVGGFPVLSAGPTPHTPLDQWTFTIDGMVDEPLRWTLGRAPGAARRGGHEATSTA